MLSKVVVTSFQTGQGHGVVQPLPSSPGKGAAGGCVHGVLLLCSLPSHGPVHLPFQWVCASGDRCNSLLATTER